MKYIIAIIKPFKLDEVREALSDIGVQGLTITEVRGFGRQKDMPNYIEELNIPSILPKVRMEIAVSDELVEQVIETIEKKLIRAKSGMEKYLFCH